MISKEDYIKEARKYILDNICDGFISAYYFPVFYDENILALLFIEEDCPREDSLFLIFGLKSNIKGIDRILQCSMHPEDFKNLDIEKATRYLNYPHKFKNFELLIDCNDPMIIKNRTIKGIIE